MSNIKEIQDRIRSVSDTQKITNAMYMISSNKLRKAKKVLADTEPYFFTLRSTMQRMSRHIPRETNDLFLESHLDIPTKERRRGYLVIVGDKGLAGSYNHNILKMAEEHIQNDGPNWKLWVIGELGRQYFKSRNIPIDNEFQFVAQNPTMGRARRIAAYMLEEYMNRDLDEIYIIYTVMKNAIVSETQFEKLLPVPVLTQNAMSLIPTDVYQESWSMSPSPEAILHNIVPIYITGFVYSALVEAYCCVQNARMMAMDSANKSAEQMIHDLNISYNRQRQSQITQEITEVVAGAKALQAAKKNGALQLK